MNVITLNIHGGSRIRVPHSLDQITPYVLLEQEDWFEDEIHFVRQYLQPGMHAVDVGANFGVYTLAMARAVGADGLVQAFEPTPDTAAMLRGSIEDNGVRQVRMHELAVSDRSGSARLRINAQSELNALGNYPDGIEVKTVTLDELSSQQNWPKVDFIKIDAEGHELQVIAGASRLLREQSPLVMFEIKAGERVDLSAVERFAALGYQAYYLLPGPLLLTPFSAREQIDPFLLNLFCCKLDRADQLIRRGLLAPRAAPSDVSANAAYVAWTKFQRETVYAPALSIAWPRRPNWFTKPDTKLYLEALFLFAWSEGAEVNTSQRIGLLINSLARVASARTTRDSLPRLLTQARLAWALGRRMEAVSLLRQAGARVDKEAGLIRREPFLTPLPRYEQIAPGKTPELWLKAAIGEASEKLGAFSSMFTGTDALASLEQLVALPMRSPEMERRRQLVRMRAHLQMGPQPHPLLAVHNEENLNSQFWCASAQAAA